MYHAPGSKDNKDQFDAYERVKEKVVRYVEDKYEVRIRSCRTSIAESWSNSNKLLDQLDRYDMDSPSRGPLRERIEKIEKDRRETQQFLEALETDKAKKIEEIFTNKNREELPFHLKTALEVVEHNLKHSIDRRAVVATDHANRNRPSADSDTKSRREFHARRLSELVYGGVSDDDAFRLRSEAVAHLDNLLLEVAERMGKRLEEGLVTNEKGEVQFDDLIQAAESLADLRVRSYFDLIRIAEKDADTEYVRKWLATSTFTPRVPVYLSAKEREDIAGYSNLIDKKLGQRAENLTKWINRLRVADAVVTVVTLVLPGGQVVKVFKEGGKWAGARASAKFIVGTAATVGAGVALNEVLDKTNASEELRNTLDIGLRLLGVFLTARAIGNDSRPPSVSELESGKVGPNSGVPETRSSAAAGPVKNPEIAAPAMAGSARPSPLQLEPELAGARAGAEAEAGSAARTGRSYREPAEAPQVVGAKKEAGQGGGTSRESSGGSSEQLPQARPSNSVKPAPGEPLSPEHKAQRWQEYQKRGGPLKYEQWSVKYEVAMQNPKAGIAREAEYRAAWGGENKRLDSPYGERQIDCYIDSERRLVQIKTGKEDLTTTAKIGRRSNKEAIEVDAWFVKQGYTVEWILEKGGSRPLLEALRKAGIVIKDGTQIK